MEIQKKNSNRPRLKDAVKLENRKQENNRAQWLQNIYRQFDRRMHDLDYLQWMQRNSSRYTAGICILAVLFSVSVLWQSENQPERKTVQPAQQYVNPAMGDDISAMQELSNEVVQESDLQQKTQNEELSGELFEQTAEVEAPTEKTHQTTEQNQTLSQEVSYRNPLHLPGYQAPSSGMLVYNYGLGYDPVYEDYRYHRELCYARGDGAVYACIDGVVSEVQLDRRWQLVLQTEKGKVQYRGLASCTVEKGTVVSAGEQIGTAEENIYIQAIKNE